MIANNSVLQDWVVDLPIRMQSTLILGLRGPDTHACPNIKSITRWLRSLAFKPGNPDNVREFMGEQPFRILEKSAVAKELEFCTQHYYSHLLHALEVVGYTHSNSEISYHAFLLFEDMCKLFHLPVESRGDFDYRLRQIDWGINKQPATFEEALAILRSK